MTNNIYIITLIIIVNYIIYYFNIPLLLNNFNKFFDKKISIYQFFNNNAFKKIKNIIVKNAVKYKNIVKNKEEEEIKIIDTILDIKENISINNNNNYNKKFINNTFYIIMIIGIINIIIHYFKILSIRNDESIDIIPSNNNISIFNKIFNKIFTKTISANDAIIYNKIKSKISIFKEQVKTKNITSEEGIFNDIHTNSIISDKIFSDTVKTKTINSEEGIFIDIHTHSITTDNNFSNKVNTNDLDAILINSKKIISESIRGEKINTDILEAKDISVISDRRFKKNIIYNNISSDLLDNINLATFEYLNQNTNHIGFIAQEIEKYYPQLINKNKNGYLSVKYLEMIPLIIDYNKKLKKRILSLEQKLISD